MQSVHVGVIDMSPILSIAEDDVNAIVGKLSGDPDSVAL